MKVSIQEELQQELEQTQQAILAEQQRPKSVEEELKVSLSDPTVYYDSAGNLWLMSGGISTPIGISNLVNTSDPYTTHFLTESPAMTPTYLPIDPSGTQL